MSKTAEKATVFTKLDFVRWVGDLAYIINFLTKKQRVIYKSLKTRFTKDSWFLLFWEF